MKISVDQASSAFSPYRSTNSVRASSSSSSSSSSTTSSIYLAQNLPDMCIVCVDMARETPGSPMSRPRDLATGGAKATLTSGAYHATSNDPLPLHGHALQQEILEVM